MFSLDRASFPVLSHGSFGSTSSSCPIFFPLGCRGFGFRHSFMKFFFPPPAGPPRKHGLFYLHDAERLAFPRGHLEPPLRSQARVGNFFPFSRVVASRSLGQLLDDVLPPLFMVEARPAEFRTRATRSWFVRSPHIFHAFFFLLDASPFVRALGVTTHFFPFHLVVDFFSRDAIWLLFFLGSSLSFLSIFLLLFVPP